MHKQSSRSMLVLRGLEYVRQWYDFSVNLIQGRFALITLSSLAGWVFEVLLLRNVSVLLFGGEGKRAFGIRDFSDYVASIFFGGGSELTKKYTLGTAMIFLAASVVMQVVYRLRVRGRGKERA